MTTMLWNDQYTSLDSTSEQEHPTKKDDQDEVTLVAWWAKQGFVIRDEPVKTFTMLGDELESEYKESVGRLYDDAFEAWCDWYSGNDNVSNISFSTWCENVKWAWNARQLFLIGLHKTDQEAINHQLSF